MADCIAACTIIHKTRLTQNMMVGLLAESAAVTWTELPTVAPEPTLVFIFVTIDICQHNLLACSCW